MALELTQWNEDLATGIGWQDAQHEELLEHFYSLYYALISGETQKELPQTIQFLDSYSKKHFGMEADYMREYDFEGTEAHLNQHKIFHERLQEIKRYLAKSGSSALVSTTANLCLELNNWFTTHIGAYDQELGKFLKHMQIK